MTHFLIVEISERTVGHCSAQCLRFRSI